MLNKFSNIATLKTLKDHLGVPFDYEYLYQPARLINGKKENSVALITSKERDKIQFGIWGLLPKNYDDEWKEFQCHLNTLETSIEQLRTSEWLYEAFQNRRCIIMATGYFTSKIMDGLLVPFYHSLEHNDIFCFAGIYNILDDGFISFSILSRHFEQENIMETTIPIVLKADKYVEYLTDGFPFKKLTDTYYEMDASLLNSQQLSKKAINNKRFNFEIFNSYSNDHSG